MGENEITAGQWLTIIIVMMALLFSALLLVIESWINGMDSEDERD